jgi:hypothetical protein
VYIYSINCSIKSLKRIWYGIRIWSILKFSKPIVTSTKQRIYTDTSPSSNNKTTVLVIGVQKKVKGQIERKLCGQGRRAHMKVKEREATIRLPRPHSIRTCAESGATLRRRESLEAHST